MTQNERDLVELAVNLYTGLHDPNRIWVLAGGLKNAAQRVSAERMKHE